MAPGSSQLLEVLIGPRQIDPKTALIHAGLGLDRAFTRH